MKTSFGIHRAIVWLLIGVSFFSLLAPAAVAQIFASNRWLLVVETSRGMQRRAEATQRVVFNLVASGLNGQMQEGDTLGLWTFNDELHTGGFELQQWSPKNADRIASRIIEFLRSQKFEREGRIERISSDLGELLKDSEFITVLIVSDGSSAKLGTSVDAQIAANFKEWQSLQSRAQMPFVTLLRAAGGTITDFLVNTPPFSLEPPELPENRLPKPAPIAVAKPTIPGATSAPAATLPPLILSGKKPDATPVPQVEKPAEAPKAEVAAQIPSTPAHVPEASIPKKTVEPVKAEPKPEPRTEVKAEPGTEPAVAAARVEPRAEAARGSATPEPAPPSVAPAAIEPQPMEADRTEPVTGVAIGADSRQTWLWVGLALGIGIGATAALLLVRRRSQTSRASLITRSLDRDQK